MIFFSTAALVSLLKWIESRLQLKFFIISAISCGLALGTKYNGLIVLFLLTIFIPFIYISYSKKDSSTNTSANRATPIRLQLKAVGFGALFAALALMVFSPWMIRNYVWKTNPIYPLYDNLFNRAISVPPNTHYDRQDLKPCLLYTSDAADDYLTV